jgi:deoxyribose-phosphate aldolase
MDDVPARIEHTVLGPETGWSDVEGVLDDALEYGMRACIPPCYVAEAVEYANVPLVTVIDFPHGQGATDAVCEAARQAWSDGAEEIDMVCNVGRLKAGEDDAVRDHVAEVVASVPVPVKVIVEAPLLTDEELDRVGKLVAEADAAFLKTATGFSGGGATVADVERLAKSLPVKASGGVGSWEEAAAMFEAGATRIGASSGDVIAREWREATGAPAGERADESGVRDGNDQSDDRSDGQSGDAAY